MKLCRIVALLCAALGASLVDSAPCQGQVLSSGESIPLSWSTDATLRDIVFTNENSGIAVGDLGTVLRTTDGGRTWKPIFISNDCSLQSISFSDGERGWIAGGYSLPFVPHSRGVLLQTTNGGAAWSELPQLNLPAITQIEFVSERLGLARVAGSEFHPSGLCTTSDVGKSWAEMAPETVWKAEAVARSAAGVIAAHHGRLGLLRNRAFQPSRQPPSDERRIRAIAMIDSQQGYALGERSLWQTSDAGESWTLVPLPAEFLASPYRTWTALAAREHTLWLAGSPGTHIAQIDLQAETVRLVSTPIRTNLHRLFFRSESLGWAVGDLGTILVTRDGGSSWTVQRSAGPRVAIMFVARTTAELPFELMARLCGDQGYLGAALVFEADQRDTMPDYDVRMRQAVQRLGVTLMVSSDATTQAAAEVEIGRLIRQVQPSTLVIAQAPDDAVHGGIDLSSAAASAAGTAAQFDAASPFETETALPYWQLPKVLLTVAHRDPGSAWGSAELLPKLSRNVTDYVLPSRGLARCAESMGVRYDTTYLNGLSLERDSEFFDATLSGPLAPPQREPLKPQGYLSQIKAMSTKAQLLQPLLDAFDDDPTSQKVWSARLDALCSELPRDVAGTWLWQLAQAYWRANKPELAAQTRHKLLTHCPQHAFALDTQRWLIHYYASGEIAHAVYRRPANVVPPQTGDREPTASRGRTVMREIELDGVKHMVWVPETSQKTPTARPAEGQQVSGTSPEPTSFAQFYRQRLEQARTLLNQLSASAGELTARPEWTWVDLALTRRLEGPPAFEARAARIASTLWTPALRDCLQREIALSSDSSNAAPLPLAECPVAHERPYLDGLLDDLVWRALAQQDKIVRLRPVQPAPAADGNTTDPAAVVRTVSDPNLGQTQVLFARDAEFLYLAIQCHFVELTSWHESSSRERDRDLALQDQVQIRIDADRDGTSAAIFEFDIDGNFRDRLEGNRGWNPDWYFAQSRSFNTWTVEAAIPLALLPAADESLRDQTWGVTIERTLPQGVCERWQPTGALPAASVHSDFDVAIPDGYLRLR